MLVDSRSPEVQAFLRAHPALAPQLEEAALELWTNYRDLMEPTAEMCGAIWESMRNFGADVTETGRVEVYCWFTWQQPDDHQVTTFMFIDGGYCGAAQDG